MTRIDSANELPQTPLEKLFGLSEWQKLLIHLELSPNNFAFIPVFVPNSSWAELCRQALADFLYETENKQLLTINLETPDELKNLASIFFNLQAANESMGAVWISAPIPFRYDELEEWKAAWREGMARLNQYRNPFREKFDIPVLLVGAEWTKSITRNIAPDLWSVITISIFIEPSKVISDSVTLSGSIQPKPFVTMQTAVEDWRGIDPHFALQEVKRLRRQKANPFNIARLLHRASGAFSIRAEYRKALQYSKEASGILYRLLNKLKTNDVGKSEIEALLSKTLIIEGITYQRLGETEKSVEQLDKAKAILKDLIAIDGYKELMINLSAVHTNKGISLDRLGRPEKALAEYDTAIEILEKYNTETNGEANSKIIRDMAAIHLNKASTFEHLGNLVEAFEELSESEKFYSASEEFAQHLAGVYINKSQIFRLLGRIDESIELSSSAIKILEKLITEQGRNELANDLATAYMNRGNSLQQLTGKIEDGIKDYDKAIGIREQLVNDRKREEIGSDLAAVYLNKSTALWALDKWDESIEECDKGIFILERLVLEKKYEEFDISLAGVYSNKGEALSNLNRFEESIELNGKALAILERLVVRKGHLELADTLASVLMNRGLTFERVSRFEDAINCFDKAIEQWEKCLERNEIQVLVAFIKGLRHRVRILSRLKKWKRVANDVVNITDSLVLFDYPDFPQYFKERMGYQVRLLLIDLLDISSENLNKIYKYAGEDSYKIQQMVNGFKGKTL